MAKPGQQIQSALMRDPTARPMPASSFRKTVAPPPRQVAQPQSARTSSPTPFDVVDNRNIGGRVIPNTPAGNRIGIGQFEQNQFNRPIPQAVSTPTMSMPSGNPFGGYQNIPQALPVNQVGIGQFEQNQFQPQVPTSVQLQPGYTGGMLGSAANGVQIPYIQQPESNYGGMLRTGAQQYPAMNQAAQIAQGATAGIGQGLKR